jgi:hypothetical protein
VVGSALSPLHTQQRVQNVLAYGEEFIKNFNKNMFNEKECNTYTLMNRLMDEQMHEETVP